MHTYPLKLPPACGTWRTANELLDVVAKGVAQHINAVMRDDPPNWIREFTARDLAKAVPYGRTFVDAMLQCCCAGNSGLAVVKGDVDRAFLAKAKWADEVRRKTLKGMVEGDSLKE